jgi:hypothetical protein
VFVGIAPTREVTRYLNGTSHALVTDVSYSPFSADYRAHPAGPQPGTPAEQTFWAATAHGTGQQALEWDVEDGDWSVVVMNEDSSRNVDAQISAGAELPFLSGIGWGVTIGGLVLLVLAAGLTVVGVRAKPREAVAA